MTITWILVARWTSNECWFQVPGTSTDLSQGGSVDDPVGLATLLV